MVLILLLAAILLLVVARSAAASCIVLEIEVVLFILEEQSFLGLEWWLLEDDSSFHDVVGPWSIQIDRSKLATHFSVALVRLASSCKLFERQLHHGCVSSERTVATLTMRLHLVVLQRGNENFESWDKDSVVEFDDVLLCAAAIHIPNELLVHRLVVLVGLLVFELEICAFDVELVCLTDGVECTQDHLVEMPAVEQVSLLHNDKFDSRKDLFA